MSQKKERLKKAIDGDAKKKKKPLALRLTEDFIEEDIDTVKDYILDDVIKPGIKDIIEDTVNNAIHMFFHGEASSRSVRKKASNGIVHTAYDRVFNGSGNRKTNTQKQKAGYAFEEVICETRREAEQIMDGMAEAIELYDVLSVMDMYDLAGLETKHTDDNWGWEDISSATIIRRAPDEFVIKMPKPTPLNN